MKNLMRLAPCLFYRGDVGAVCGSPMLKWLLALGLFLYASLMIGGTDNGQLRAGLRDLPAAPAEVASASPPPEETVLRSTVAELVPMMPAPPPLRVLPAPPKRQAEAPAAQDGLVQAALEQPADTAAAGETIRWVAVERANVRADASKSATVTGRIERGEAVTVLWTEPSGWARVRIEGDGVDGFVHESLLTDLNPQFQ
ncbi:MAG: hypothetical protein CFE34_12505 [Rhodobacteraceae bacterium PARR1]|nr:MAG: hypothetical protein CFE34_12505 [Rhodobacteraceae bacterium PARR1]